MNHNHLSTAEVVTYRGNIRSLHSINTGRHLLACKECRSKLPAATLEEFRSCILDSRLVSNEESKSAGLFDFTQTTMVWSVARVTAFAGLAILLLAGAYFVGVHRFIISDDTIAKNENDSITDRFNLPEEAPVLAPSSSEKPRSSDTQNPNIALDRDRTNEPPVSISAPTTNLDKDRPLPGQRRDVLTNPQKKQVIVTPGNTSRNLAISPTRGPGSKCADEAVLEMELESIGTGLLLKWRKFPNAAKYHIYVSDDDEILIDEFETVKDTSYVLNRPLDPKKSYRWKIIVTLENGQTVSADSRRFTSKDFQSVQNASTTRRKTVSRCAESH